MTRPLPIAASLALALLSLAAFAQTPPAAQAPTAASGTPAESPVASMAEQVTPAAPSSSQSPASLTGNAANGAKLTYTCQGCHGVPGYKNAYPNFHVPRIGGQSPEYLSTALHEYRKGARKHPTMQAQAESFSEQDIADIAAFLSSLKP